MKDKKTISEFTGEYYFLSNFYSTPVTCFGYTFQNNEAAFQAAKCPVRMQEFCNLNPSEAKRLGRRVHLRTDWEDIKEDVMYEVCKAKFFQNTDLAVQLIKTGGAELIEGNTWGDRCWGVCEGVGENRLGKILMQIRDEINHMVDELSKPSGYVITQEDLKHLFKTEEVHGNQSV